MTLRELLVLELMGRVPTSEINPERQRGLDEAVGSWMARESGLVNDALAHEEGVVRGTDSPPDLAEVAAKLAPIVAKMVGVPAHPLSLYGHSSRSQE